MSKTPSQSQSQTQSLELEYAVIYKMYEEAYANYQKTLKDSVTVVEEDPCKVFSRDSTNISQDCYAKIWKASGCTEKEQDVTTDYLSKQTKKGLKDDSDQWATLNDDTHNLGCYGTKEGKPAVDNSDKWSTIKGYIYEDGSNKSGVDSESKTDCLNSCANTKGCSGATYNSGKKLCWVKSGNGEITEGTSDDYAIVTVLKQQAFVLQQLNAKLIDINNQMSQNMTENEGFTTMDTGSGASSGSGTDASLDPVIKYVGLFVPSETTIRLNKLIADKAEIDKAIAALDDTSPNELDGELRDSALMVKQSYMTYLFMFFILLCLVAFLTMGTVFSKITAVFIVMVLIVMFSVAKS